jgi:hypothetical protein
MQLNLENRSWWTTLDDFEGGWCPCTGAVRKLPNVILNIWHRQSGKSTNLAKVAVEHKVKHPSKKVCIITTFNTRYIVEKIEKIVEEENLGDAATGIHIANALNNIELLFSQNDFDLLLLDEFLHYEEKDLSKIVEGWNSGNRTGTIVGWTTPSKFGSYDKMLRTVEMIGGSRVMINRFRASDNPEIKVPRYLTKEEIDLEYNLR